MDPTKQLEGRRWLRVAEFSALYGVMPGTARRWAKQGRVTAIRVPPGPRARIYIVDPGWTQFDAPTSQDPAEWFCFLRQSEAAALLGITARGLRYLETAGKAHYRLVGHRKLYSVSELRRLIAQRTLMRRSGNSQEKRRAILRWAHSQLVQK
jgi:hypothetical protein